MNNETVQLKESNKRSPWPIVGGILLLIATFFIFKGACRQATIDAPAQSPVTNSVE